jgi:hypothetical protein
MATATKTAASKKVFGKGGPKKLSKFKDEPRDDFENWKPIEHVGEIVVLYVHGVEDVKTSKFGVRPAIKVDVQVANEDLTALSEPLKKILIFNTAIVGQLEELAGTTQAARIGTYESQSGGDAPRLEELEDDELEEVEKLFA